jgi:hypothetical protein
MDETTEADIWKGISLCKEIRIKPASRYVTLWGPQRILKNYGKTTKKTL